MGGAEIEGERDNPRLLVGQLIKGKYRLVQKLATGNLGAVYLAEQRGAGIQLVLKVFRTEFGKDSDLVAKLRRQMLAVAALSEKQPNIARVYDCDQAEDGSPFIAVEHLAGRTLREVMREAGPLETGRTLSLAAQMAAGLSAAHAAGIVHTDIHPQNFFVLEEEEAIKIIGFERARLRNVGALDHVLPAIGVSRTPEYVAPEQVRRGPRADISHQTDIYAFGIILYEMLTGTVPFQASTPEGVLAMHLHMVPAPLKALRPEIPVEVEAKVLQALEKEPKWRENTANDVVSELVSEVVPRRSRAKERPTSVPRTVQTERDSVRLIVGRRQWVGSRWRLAAISGVLIAIAAAAGWVLYSRRAAEVTYTTPVAERLEKAAPRPEPATVGTSKTIEESKEKPVEKPLPAKPPPPSLPTRTKAAPSAAPPKQGDTTSPPRAIPSPAPSPSTARETPTTSPDPSEIIDWLFKQPGATKP